jgi:Protein of unknown function (DUF4232)
MDPHRKSDRILSDWNGVAHMARRPAAAPRRRRPIAGLGSGLGLAGAGLLAAALVVAVAWLGGRITPDVGSAASVSPSTTPSSIAASESSPAPSHAPSASHAPAPSHAPSASHATSATSSPAPQENACAVEALSARITTWEGAAGSRIADVTVTNTSPTACRLPAGPSLALVDGSGAVLIEARKTATGTIHLAAGASVTTLVAASNYCGPQPAPPVRIAFELPTGSLLAAPPSPTDATVPPCNGATVPASIEMQPWTRP